MRRLIYAFLVYLLANSAGFAQRQTLSTKSEVLKGREIICPTNHLDANTVIDLPIEIKQALERRKLRGEKGISAANIIVEYIDFPENAKNAFQKAIDIWAVSIKSDVPIRVIALWQPLGRNVLGSASPTDYRSYFPGIPVGRTWFPMPLAEKISGKDLNSINEYDILCRFSSDTNWYLGDLNPAVGQFDFTSVVLHELCHGLGFVGSMTVSDDNTTGYYGYGTNRPFIFDTFAENGVAKKLTDTTFVKNNTAALKNELISDDIFFNGPITTKKFNGVKPKLYTPNPWDQGSSFSHLDDDTYPAGTPNSLMTPNASIREKNLSPGEITMSMFEDMGWKRTAIIHEPIKDYTSTNDVVVKAKILSDTTVDFSSAKLIYTTNFSSNGTFLDSTVVAFTKVNATDVEATIKLGGTAKTVLYYLKVDDKLSGNIVTSPPQAPRYIWQFSTGKNDTNGPLIDHSPATIIPATSNFVVLTNVEDDFAAGIDTVYVNYAMNGATQSPFGLKKFNLATDNKDLSQGSVDEFAYFKEGAFGNLKAGDKIKYQIVAKDKAGNTTILPTRSEGSNQTDANVATFYEIAATSLKNSVETYVNDFETSTNDDFATLGFTIGKPSGFTSNILYTEGGYSNGKGLSDPSTGNTYVSFSNNQIALLRSPLILDDDESNATIIFDEVVLVEPGEAGAVFGDDDFWDYVIVEGSYDGGMSWIPFADGYDSGSQAVWKNRFNNTLSSGTTPISTGVGEQALMKQRVIKIYDGEFGDVDSGTEVIVRFRLFSDQWVRGWGWAIDNVRLQTPVPKPLAVENIPTKTLTVSPNPTSDYLDVAFPLTKPQTVEFEIFQTAGGKVLQQKVESTSNAFTHRIDVRTLHPGTYILKIMTDDGFKAKRFVIHR